MQPCCKIGGRRCAACRRRIANHEAQVAAFTSDHPLLTLVIVLLAAIALVYCCYA